MLRQSTQIAVALAAVAALGACASKPEPVAEAPAPTPVATPLQPTGPVPGSLADFQASAQERVFFDFDSADIRADARTDLDRQAAWLNRYRNVRVTIEGNADERGTREYNLALGARRAAAVKEYLVNAGVAADRIETISYGKERPLDARSNEEAWALNRNARTAITSGATS